MSVSVLPVENLRWYIEKGFARLTKDPTGGIPSRAPSVLFLSTTEDDEVAVVVEEASDDETLQNIELERCGPR